MLNTRIFTLGLVALLGWSSLALAWGGHRASSNCEKSARTMQYACTADAHDDYLTTVANCQNISGRGERRACDREAWSQLMETYSGCGDVSGARQMACNVLQEDRYDPDPLASDAIRFIDPDDVPSAHPPNPYVSIAAGHTYVLLAGEELEETVIVHVTGDTRDILGVDCRVVVDVVVEVSQDEGETEYEPVELTDDWFAQDVDGNVYYCGEIARNYEDGILRDLDGSFEAGRDFAKSGVLIQRYPVAGQAHRQEFSLGEAEDIVQYVSLASGPSVEEGGDNEAFPCGSDGCLKTYDFAPIEPESTEFKYYLPGTGFVLAVAMEDGEITGEREELLCVGDSLDVLHEPACGIADPELLLEQLCRLSPEAFCDEED